MARTLIPLTILDRNGELDPTATNSDATNGMYVNPGNYGVVIMEFENVNASTRTVGISLNATGLDGVAIPDKVITLLTTEKKKSGAWVLSLYRQNDGYIYVNPSINTDIKIRAWGVTTS